MCVCSRMFQPAPRIDGPCVSVRATTRSLTFQWTSAKSATLYNLDGHEKSRSSGTNTTTVDDLTPGSRYTFRVWAVGWESLVSNNIRCTDSTGSFECFLCATFYLPVRCITWFRYHIFVILCDR